MLLLLVLLTSAKKTELPTEYNYGKTANGTKITLTFHKGVAHNHPLFAIWLADDKGRYLETLYVSESIAKGVFPKASRKNGFWESGEIQRPAALPYWAHQRNILNEYGTYNPTPRKPLLDGVTGATPDASFVLNLRSKKVLSGSYTLYFEVNQSWDWNEYWFNNRFPGDKEYATSSQPALVYSVDLIVPSTGKTWVMKPVGHSHPSGADGSLTTNLSTLTTALKIAESLSVTLP